MDADHPGGGVLIARRSTIKRRADVTGIFPDDEAILRPVGALMPETSDEWAVARRHTSLETLARAADNTNVRLPAVAA